MLAARFHDRGAAPVVGEIPDPRRVPGEVEAGQVRGRAVLRPAAR